MWNNEWCFKLILFNPKPPFVILIHLANPFSTFVSLTVLMITICGFHHPLLGKMTTWKIYHELTSFQCHGRINYLWTGETKLKAGLGSATCCCI